MIRTRRYMWLVPVGAVIALTGLGGAWLVERSSDRDLAGITPHLVNETEPGGDRPRGTSGTDQPAAIGNAASVESPAMIRELETITGSVDGHELIGRRVTLHVPVQEQANDVAFWVGGRDNRVLVALNRDTRDDRARLESRPPAHGIASLDPGRQVTISGTVQRIPKAEDMFSWQLTADQKKELADRKIYIRADSVIPETQAP